MYAKLKEDGQLEIAPLNYIDENSNLYLNFNNNKELLNTYGFKEVIENIPDYNKDIETLILSSYKEVDDHIEPVYTKEFIIDIEDLRKKKLEELNDKYTSFIQNNPLPSNIKDNTLQYYECTEERQNQLVQTISLYELSEKIGVPYTCNWNHINGPCEEWTIKEIIQLSLQMKSYIYPLLSYRNNMTYTINSLDNIYDLYNIEINYEKINEEE